MTTIAQSKIDQCYRLLHKTNSNVVWEILRQSDKFYQWQHYPKGDVYDRETHSQYYYHAHNPETNTRSPEHGHFHLFIRQNGIPKAFQPLALPKAWQNPKKNEDILCHLIAISMDKQGHPIRLFTTNRWVTGETWYPADAVIALVDHFAIDHAWPSWPTNIWVTQMIKRYQQEIKQLIIERDQILEQWQQQHSGENPYEDRNLEVMSQLDISADANAAN